MSANVALSWNSKLHQCGVSAILMFPCCRYTGEAFHFVSYVPVNNRLIELDGLKKYPIDHGPIPDPANWTEKLRAVITERLGIATGGGVPYHDIRFALMALVPDTRAEVARKLGMLRTNREIVIKGIWSKKYSLLFLL